MSECNPVRGSAPLLDGGVPELTGHRAEQAAAKPSAPEPKPKAVAAAAAKKHARAAKRCLPGSGEAGRRSLGAASLQAPFG
jgi:hypothetical protein